MSKSRVKNIIAILKKYNLIITLWIPLISVLIYATISSFTGQSVQISLLALMIALFIFIISIAQWVYDNINGINKAISNGTVKTYLNDKELYSDCANILSTEDPSIIRHAILHAHDGRKREHNDVDNKSFHKAFDAALKDCIINSGTGSWKVQTLILVTSLDRLISIKNFIKSNFNTAKYYEVKIYITPKALPYLSYMIIGEEHAILGLDDKSKYRVKDGFHLRGKDSVKLLIEYFDSLWHNKEAIEIRSAREFDDSQLAEIRNNFDKFLTAKSN